jgi:hypothetical protein
MTRKEQDALLAQSGMPNKWLRFYMRYLLLFQIIFAFVPMVLFIPLLLPLISDNPLLLLQFTVILTMAVLAILSYYYSLRGLSFKAYCWNFAYLCYIPAAYTEYLIAIASSRYALNSVISIGLFIAPRLLLCILWIVPTSYISANEGNCSVHIPKSKSQRRLKTIRPDCIWNWTKPPHTGRQAGCGGEEAKTLTSFLLLGPGASEKSNLFGIKLYPFVHNY